MMAMTDIAHTVVTDLVAGPPTHTKAAHVHLTAAAGPAHLVLHATVIRAAMMIVTTATASTAMVTTTVAAVAATTEVTDTELVAHTMTDTDAARTKEDATTGAVEVVMEVVVGRVPVVSADLLLQNLLMTSATDAPFSFSNSPTVYAQRNSKRSSRRSDP